MKLVSLSNTAINMARWLGIQGEGYKSDEEARAAGLRAKASLMLASATRKFGVNCGEDERIGWVHKSIKDEIRDKEGVTVLDAVHGLVVYEDVGPVKFIRVEAHAQVGRQPEGLVAAFDDFLAMEPNLTEEEKTCIELINASQFEGTRAAFLTLMTACEVLCPQERRTNSFEQLLDDLKSMLEAVEGTEQDKEALKKELDQVRAWESIRSACRTKITALLGKRDFKLFDHLYGVRSKITHEGTKAADIQDLQLQAHDLVCRLLLASKRGRSQPVGPMGGPGGDSDAG